VPLGNPLEMTLAARLNVLRGLRGTIDRWLADAGADGDERFDVTLSASEAATNAIQHAYGGSEASFTVRCERDGPRVTISVRDAGRWRTARQPSGGKGLEIIRALVDDVRIDSDDDGTVVTMSKRLSGDA
jgi:anti-sigma regulatory factor (Ser/Thr protein kinase)